MAADVAGLLLLWQAGFSHIYFHSHYIPEMEEGTFVETHFVHLTSHLLDH